VHDVARVHQARAGAPADRCGDGGVAQLHLGGVDLRLVHLQRRFQLGHQRPLGVELLARGRILRDQGF
jgi:hypothetical protein